MMQSEIFTPFYVPQGDNLYAIKQRALVTTTGCDATLERLLSFPVADTNRLRPYDEDPLTEEELTDLEESYRDLSEGRYELLSRELSDDEFFANF